MILLRGYAEVLSSDGKRHIVAEIDVDTDSELPSQEYGEYYLHMGSIAHDISTGNFYCISSGGIWYNQDGSDAPSNTVQPLNSPLRLNDFDAETIQPEQFESEDIGEMR